MKALEGIRVLDLTRALAGPFCTLMLGDNGADVIKVEIPGTGDDTRKWGPPFIGEESAYYLSINRNKRSLTLNLQDAQAQEVFMKLAKDIDVVVENFTPGVMGRFGLDYDAVKAVSPKVVYCSISGFGQDGPYRNRPAYDQIMQGVRRSVHRHLDARRSSRLADLSSGLLFRQRRGPQAHGRRPSYPGALSGVHV